MLLGETSLSSPPVQGWRPVVGAGASGLLGIQAFLHRNGVTDLPEGVSRGAQGCWESRGGFGQRSRASLALTSTPGRRWGLKSPPDRSSAGHAPRPVHSG